MEQTAGASSSAADKAPAALSPRWFSQELEAAGLSEAHRPRRERRVLVWDPRVQISYHVSSLLNKAEQRKNKAKDLRPASTSLPIGTGTNKLLRSMENQVIENQPIENLGLQSRDPVQRRMNRVVSP